MTSRVLVDSETLIFLINSEASLRYLCAVKGFWFMLLEYARQIFNLMIRSMKIGW